MRGPVGTRPSLALCLAASALCLLPVLLPARAQTVLRGVDTTGAVFERTYAPGTLVHVLARADTIRSVHTLDLNEEVSVIVELRAPALAGVRAEALRSAGKQQGVADAEARVSAEQASLRSALRRLEAGARARRGPSARTAAAVQVTRTFRGVLNGVALRTRRWMLDEIARLPEVRRIHEDRPVAAVDDGSNTLVGADRAWRELGVTGRGQVIAILDTGIDHLHPVLGGGRGPDRKVIGGYDFINDDADPMDDHGHGTHVAGIAAADHAGLKGVAPGARLLAVKVLDQAGFGSASSIVAGLEYAVDPDGDPATDDAVDVANLSLGGAGTPDDPISQAVDNATRSGVLCVVAAGNTGGYQTVGSPGVAAGALTVGASDAYDRMAYFSSAGPVVGTFAVKPDLVAPGVAIRSARAGGGFVHQDGTSMATPHVAGAAALLKERHPDWTPERLKAALTLAARGLGSDVWTEGHGRLDVYEAVRGEALVVPATLSPGLVDASQPEWRWHDTLTLVNTGAGTKTFDLSTEALPAGASDELAPTRVTLALGASADVRFTLRVDNRVLPYPLDPLPGYDARVVARTDAGDVLTVPFAFVKSRGLVLRVPDWTLIVWVVAPDGTSWAYMPPGPVFTALLPAGTYDVITLVGVEGFPQIYHEGIVVEDMQRLDVRLDQARHRVRLEGFTPAGDSLLIQSAALLSSHKSGFVSMLMPSPYAHHLDLFYSDVSTDYTFDFYLHPYADPLDPRTTFVEGPTLQRTGIDASVTLRNDPAGAVHTRMDVSYAPEPGVSTLFVTDWLCLRGGCFAHYETVPEAPNWIRAPFRRSTYHLPGPSSVLRYQQRVAGTGPTYEGDVTHLRYDFPHMRFGPEQIDFSRPYDTTPLLSQAATPVLDLGAGMLLPRWGGKIERWGSLLYVNGLYGGTGWTPGLFLDPIGTIRPALVPYRLVQRGALVREGTLVNAPEVYAQYLDVPDGPYELELLFDHYYVNGRRGRARAVVSGERDTGSPPTLRALLLRSDGRVAHTVERHAENELVVEVAGDGRLGTPTLRYRLAGEAGWSALSLAPAGTRLRAVLPTALAGGFYDVEVTAEDEEGNTLRYEVVPAFFVAGLPHPVLQAPADGARSLPARPELAWGAVRGADRYHLQLAEDTAFVQRVVDDSLVAATAFRLPALAHDRTYHWRVRAVDAFGPGAWSARRRFTTVVAPPDSVRLATPAPGTTRAPVTPLLRWHPTPRAARYHVQLTDTTSFAVLAFEDSTLTATERSVGPLAFEHRYQWRVRAVNAGGVGPWSTPFAFVTAPQAPALPELTAPPLDAADLPTHVAFAWKDALRAERYRFQLATRADFTPTAVDTIVAAPSLPRAGLPHATRFYWRVQAQNAGGKSDWSESGRFTTIVAAPAAVSLTEPADGALDQPSRPTLRWASAETATRYHLQMGTDADLSALALDDSTLTRTTFEAGVLAYAGAYHWQVRAGNRGGWGPWSPRFRFSVSVGTGIERVGEGVPDAFALHAGYPNPFNGEAAIPFDLAEAGEVSLVVYDALGRAVAQLVSGALPAGRYQYRWEAARQPSGLYVCRLRTGSFVQSRTLLLLK